MIEWAALAVALLALVVAGFNFRDALRTTRELREAEERLQARVDAIREQEDEFTRQAMQDFQRMLHNDS
jgi:hypothetical protein